MKKKVKNKFPLDHLSASSVRLLESSEKLWIAKYIYGEDGYTNEHMKFGRETADFFDDDILIECILKRGKDKLKVIGLLDNQKGDTQYENKTGLKAWTQAQADSSFQLKTYAMIHYVNHGKLPKQVLTWRGTKMVDGKLELTGESKVFHVKPTVLSVLSTQAKYWKAYDKIIKLTEKEYAKI